MPSIQIIEQQFKQYVLDDADTSMALGAEQYLGQLGDNSLAYELARTAEAKTLLTILLACNSDDFDNQLDLDLMQRHLKQDIFFAELTLQGQPQRCRKPHGVDGISAGIFQLFVNDERSAEARLNNILTRLEQAPDYLHVEAGVISQPVSRWRDIECAQGEGIADLFASIIDWAETEHYPKTLELKQAVIKANAALTIYLDDLKSRDTISEFAIGESKVQALLELRKIKQSPSELAQMASDFMQETQQLLAELKTRLCKKYGLPEKTSEAELQSFLNKQFAATLKDGELASLLDHYTDQIDAINHFVADKQLFPLPAAQTMKILQTPSFLEPVIPAGAMWPPLALREGKKTSLVYLTLKEDQLAEHTQLGIPVMMIHEGIPGHHLQFSTAAMHPSFVRRIFSANEHAEGWTTMLEDYMLDIGYIKAELIDEVRFIAKREMSRLVARVGIDLYFMTANKDYLNVGLDIPFDADDVFVNAAKLLKKATGFTDGRVQAELNWYSCEQGYPLSYLTGNCLVWQLKKDIQQMNKKQLAPQALDQAFHEVYLHSGCMPVESLREVFVHKGFL